MSDADTRYVCKTCGEGFDNRTAASTHARKHRSKPYQKDKDATYDSPVDRVREVEVDRDDGIESSLRRWAAGGGDAE